MSDEILAPVVLYAGTLGVPARRRLDDPQVRRGEALFAAVRCQHCHVATLTTGRSDLAELSGQVIHPYTDLLLHHLGPGLADDRPAFEASGREWRTAPLWGIGLIHTVNGHTFLLHDGRARTLVEAIAWHDGEARESRERFERSDRRDRVALIAFLESL